MSPDVRKGAPVEIRDVDPAKWDRLLEESIRRNRAILEALAKL